MKKRNKLAEEAGDRSLTQSIPHVKKFKIIKCNCDLQPTSFVFAEADCECGLNYSHIHCAICGGVYDDEVK